MKVLITAAATAALLGVLAAPAPLFAEEDCDNVTKALEEGVAISLKDFETTMADPKKTKRRACRRSRRRPRSRTRSAAPAASFSASSRAARVRPRSAPGNQRSALAAFDKSIKEMETAIDNTCK